MPTCRGHELRRLPNIQPSRMLRMPRMPIFSAPLTQLFHWIEIARPISLIPRNCSHRAGVASEASRASSVRIISMFLNVTAGRHPGGKRPYFTSGENADS